MPTPIDQLKREALADLAGRIEVPSYTSNGTVLPKWVRRNEEWVRASYEITRGPGGLSDRPAGTDMNAKPGAGK